LYGKGPIRFGMDEEGKPFVRDDYRAQFDEKYALTFIYFFLFCVIPNSLVGFYI
jgi:hypothetical protein